MLIGIGQALTFLDEIKISYAGTTLQAKDGTNVQSFSQELVENTLPTVHVIPGKIEAEAFTTMDGIALENTTDIGGGQNIGYLPDRRPWRVEIHRGDLKDQNEIQGLSN